MTSIMYNEGNRRLQDALDGMGSSEPREGKTN